MKNLSGKTTVITGASKGIGAALARQLSGEGVHTALLARSADHLDQLANSIKTESTRAIAVPTDITKWEQVKSAYERIMSEFGTIDYLINNAGVAHWNPVVDCTEEQWDEMMNLNLKGMFLCTKLFTPVMMKAKSGHVINISSSLGKHAAPGFSGYSASKFAITGFSEAIALELKPQGVKVTTVYPGIVDTEFRDHMTNRPKATAWQDTSKMLTADDVAEAILYVMKTEDTAIPSELFLNAAL